MDVVELASALIGYNTEIPPGNEEPCARFLHDYVRDLHLENTNLDLHPFKPNRANLVARIGPDTPGLLLSGHIDVVPAGDTTKWESPPFEGNVRGDRLFGRGAADMKTGVAAFAKALDIVKGATLKRGVIFVATAGEEVGYDGMRKLVDDKKIREGEASYAVVGEPTHLNVVRGHRGGSTFKVTFEGVSAHASSPQLGVNAIENCSRFMGELTKVRRRIAREKDKELGISMMTPTVIKGGTKSNVIPESCELTIDSRRIPKHSGKLFEAEIKSIIKKMSREDKSFRAQLELMYESYPLIVPRKNELVRLAEEIAGAGSTIAPYGTEAPFYQRLGIPAIVLGPGSVKEAHIPNEYVEVREARKAVSIYTKLIERVCM